MQGTIKKSISCTYKNVTANKIKTFKTFFYANVKTLKLKQDNVITCSS